MSKDKIVGSTMLPSTVLTPSVDTDEFRMGLETINEISQDYMNYSHKSLATSKALYMAFMAMQDAVNSIDPDNKFFKDNSLISQSLLSPTFDKETDWILNNWELIDNKASYANLGSYDNNELRLSPNAFVASGDLFLRIDIERIDTGTLTLYSYDDRVIATFSKKGTYYVTYPVENPHIDSLRLVSKGLLENENVVISYFGVYLVQERFTDYLAHIFAEMDIDGSGSEELLEQFVQIRKELIQRMSELSEEVEVHKDGINPHGISVGMIDAAHKDHTHTAEELGVSKLGHTHTPDECNAATEDHTHTAEELGVSKLGHTHTPDECGAAAKKHEHPGLVTKETLYATTQILTQRINNIEGNSDEYAGTNGAVEPPLTVISVAPDQKGVSLHKYPEHSDFTLTKVPMLIAGTPMFTVNTCSIHHIAESYYDLHAGRIGYHDTSTGLSHLSNVHEVTVATNPRFLGFSLKVNPSIKAAPYDVFRTTIDTTTRRPSAGLTASTNTPIMTTAGISENTPMIWTYTFQTPKYMEGITFERIFSSDITEQTSDILAQGGCIKKAYVTYFYTTDEGTQEEYVIEVNAPLEDWDGRYFTKAILSQYKINSYSVKVVDVHPLITSYDVPNNSVWSLKIIPKLKGSPNSIDTVPGSVLVGHVEADSGVTDLSIAFPKSTTIPPVMMNTVVSNRLQVGYYNKTMLNVSDGDYDIVTYISPYKVEACKNVPYGDPLIMGCIPDNQMLGDRVVHDYWGVGHPTFLRQSTSKQTHHIHSGYDPGILFTYNTAVAISGITVVFQDEHPDFNNLDRIEVRLHCADDTTIDKVWELKTSTMHEGVVYIPFNEVHSSITGIRVTLHNVAGALGGYDVVSVRPHLVGICYNPLTKTLYDYNLQRPISGILGSVTPVTNGTKVEYIPNAVLDHDSNVFIMEKSLTKLLDEYESAIHVVPHILDVPVVYKYARSFPANEFKELDFADPYASLITTVGGITSTYLTQAYNVIQSSDRWYIAMEINE